MSPAPMSSARACLRAGSCCARGKRDRLLSQGGERAPVPVCTCAPVCTVIRHSGFPLSFPVGPGIPAFWLGWCPLLFAGALPRKTSSLSWRSEFAMFFSSWSRSFSRRLRCTSIWACGTSMETVKPDIDFTAPVLGVSPDFSVTPASLWMDRVWAAMSTPDDQAFERAFWGRG